LLDRFLAAPKRLDVTETLTRRRAHGRLSAMTSAKPPSVLHSDPDLAPSPLPFGPALVRGAVLALALGVAACGDADDGDAVPMVPADMGQRDLGRDGSTGPMPPPVDFGPETDAGSDEDLGASDLGTDAGIIAPMPPPPDSGIIAPMPPPMPPPMPDPMPDPIPPMPPPPPPPK